jgi:hypothetical protein
MLARILPNFVLFMQTAMTTPPTGSLAMNLDSINIIHLFVIMTVAPAQVHKTPSIVSIMEDCDPLSILPIPQPVVHEPEYVLDRSRKLVL